MAGPTLGLRGKDSPTQKSNSENPSSSEEDEKKRAQYRCRYCGQAVATVGDEIQVGQIPVLTAQVNPHGFVHEVFTVSKAINYHLEGTPEPADSWFPGYFWRICLCLNCLSHLGWSYHRPQEESVVFFGLRRNAVIED